MIVLAYGGVNIRKIREGLQLYHCEIIHTCSANFVLEKLCENHSNINSVIVRKGMAFERTIRGVIEEEKLGVLYYIYDPETDKLIPKGGLKVSAGTQ